MQKSVRKFSDFTDSQKEYFLNYYNNVLLGGAFGFKWEKPKDNFNELGLKFDYDYLNELGINNIFLPLEYMSEYADIVTVKAIDSNNITFKKTALGSLIIDNMNSIDFDNINATGIGNLAYCYLHSNDEQLQYEILIYLNKILHYQINKFSGLINDIAK